MEGVMVIDLLKKLDHALEQGVAWLLKIPLAPIWVPWMIIDKRQFHAQTQPLVRGRIEDAWERCCDVWRQRGLVCLRPAHDEFPSGPVWTAALASLVWQWSRYHGAAFEQRLTWAMAQQHRRQKAFFLGKLSDPDPLLAAYACLCLCGVRKLLGEELNETELPPGALERQESIRQLWMGRVDELPLGRWLEGCIILANERKYQEKQQGKS
jgi:hypothetical protein